VFVILALGRLRQEGHEFKTSLSYIVRSCPKEKREGKGWTWWHMPACNPSYSEGGGSQPEGSAKWKHKTLSEKKKKKKHLKQKD
jgi:hypothetical protein